MKVTIYVTQKDINNGCRGEAEACPIHRSLSRRLKPNTLCAVGGRIGLKAGRGGRMSTVEIPQAAKWFIMHFDQSLPTKPARFTFDIPKRFLAKVAP